MRADHGSPDPGSPERVRTGLRAGLEARDHRRAARAASSLLLTAALVTAVSVVVSPPAGGPVTTGLVAANPAVQALLAAAVNRVARRSDLSRVPLPVWTVPAVLGAVLITVLDLFTHDASAGAQVFFCFPVLYAASQLRAPAAYPIAGLAVAGDALVNLLALPRVQAVSTFAAVGATLVAITVLLVRAGERQDRLTGHLRRQASTDPLTGLVTRRILDDAARTALRSAGCHEGTALVLVDIDRFKAVNDDHGHPVGDAALVHVTQVLTRLCRPADVVSRLGGDEIAVLLPGCTADTARERAELLAIAVRESPLTTPTRNIGLTVSVGTAHSPTHADDLRLLYAAADAALYAAKRAGRDRVVSAPAAPRGTRRSERDVPS